MNNSQILNKRFVFLAKIIHQKVEELNAFTAEARSTLQEYEPARQADLHQTMAARQEALCTICAEIFSATDLQPLYSEEGIGSTIVRLLHDACTGCRTKIQPTGQYESNRAKYFQVNHRPANGEGFDVKDFTGGDWQPAPSGWKYASEKPIGLRSELVKRYNLSPELALIPSVPTLDAERLPHRITPPDLRVGLQIQKL